MSETAIGFRDSRAARFWSAVSGKKAVMGATGAALLGFLVFHMVGNMLVFGGREHFNFYALKLLRFEPSLLWAARLALLAMAILHIWASVQLAMLNKLNARPVGYVRKKNIGSTYASRTMYWSGPIILAFLIYHLMQFTWGTGGTPFNEADPYGNLVQGFHVIPIAAAYIVAMGLLMLHLYHGIWSMFQSLGFNHPRYTPLLRRLAQVISIALFLGFSSIPVAVMAGWVA